MVITLSASFGMLRNSLPVAPLALRFCFISHCLSLFESLVLANFGFKSGKLYVARFSPGNAPLLDCTTAYPSTGAILSPSTGWALSPSTGEKCRIETFCPIFKLAAIDFGTEKVILSPSEGSFPFAETREQQGSLGSILIIEQQGCPYTTGSEIRYLLTVPFTDFIMPADGCACNAVPVV